MLVTACLLNIELMNTTYVTLHTNESSYMNKVIINYCLVWLSCRPQCCTTTMVWAIFASSSPTSTVMGWSKNMHIKELFLHNPNCVTCLPTYMSAKVQPDWWTFRDAEALATFPIWTMAKVWVLTSLLILCAVNSQIMWNKALKFRISLSFCLSRYICVNTTLND